MPSYINLLTPLCVHWSSSEKDQQEYSLYLAKGGNQPCLWIYARCRLHIFYVENFECKLSSNTWAKHTLLDQLFVTSASTGQVKKNICQNLSLKQERDAIMICLFIPGRMKMIGKRKVSGAKEVCRSASYYLLDTDFRIWNLSKLSCLNKPPHWQDYTAPCTGVILILAISSVLDHQEYDIFLDEGGSQLFIQSCLFTKLKKPWVV